MRAVNRYIPSLPCAGRVCQLQEATKIKPPSQDRGTLGPPSSSYYSLSSGNFASVEFEMFGPFLEVSAYPSHLHLGDPPRKIHGSSSDSQTGHFLITVMSNWELCSRLSEVNQLKHTALHSRQRNQDS